MNKNPDEIAVISITPIMSRLWTRALEEIGENFCRHHCGKSASCSFPCAEVLELAYRFTAILWKLYVEQN